LVLHQREKKIRKSWEKKKGKGNAGPRRRSFEAGKGMIGGSVFEEGRTAVQIKRPRRKGDGKAQWNRCKKALGVTPPRKGKNGPNRNKLRPARTHVREKTKRRKKKRNKRTEA